MCPERALPYLSLVHGYNGGRGTLKRSAAEAAVKCVLVSPTERSEPDELGYATVGRKVAGSSPETSDTPRGTSLHSEAETAGNDLAISSMQRGTDARPIDADRPTF